MAQITNGILFWGYCWDEECQPWGKGSAEDAYAAAVGFSSSDDEDDWHKKRELADAAPCKIVSHCMAACEMYGVAVAETIVVARRGCPVGIDSAKLVVQPEWREKLDAYCALMKIDVTGMQPGWYLASWWN